MRSGVFLGTGDGANLRYEEGSGIVIFCDTAGAPAGAIGIDYRRPGRCVLALEHVRELHEQLVTIASQVACRDEFSLTLDIDDVKIALVGVIADVER